MLGHNKSLTLVAFSCFFFTKLLLVVVLSLPQLAWDKKSLFQFNVVYYQPSKGDHPKGFYYFSSYFDSTSYSSSIWKLVYSSRINPHFVCCFYLNLTARILGRHDWLYRLHFNQLGLVSSVNLVSFDLQCMHGPKCKLGSNCMVGRRLQEINVLGGLILPVWGAVAKALAKQVCLFFYTKTMFSLTWSTCRNYQFITWSVYIR